MPMLHFSKKQAMKRMDTATSHRGSFLFTMTPPKCIILLSGILLVSLCVQSYLDSSTEQETLSFLSNPPRGLEIGGDIIMLRRKKERRIPVKEDEFWLTDSDTAILPFDIDFEAPDSPYGELHPIPSCDSTNATGERPKKLIFVHVVRTEAFLVHDLLSSYANSCHAGYAVAAMCSGLSWESMISGTWANRRMTGSKAGMRCILKSATDRTGKTMEGTKYIQSTLLQESIDVLAGQIPLGSHEKWKDSHSNKVVDAQYIVSLRCPYAWFISNMIDKVVTKDANAGVDDVVNAIKEKVEDDLSSGIYHEVYARYLITPSQISWIQKEDAELGVEHRVDLSLRNLKDFGSLIVIKEKMDESLEKLQFLLDANGKQNEIFVEAKKQLEKKETGSISVDSVLAALKGDTAFYEHLQEYLKYEEQIYSEAKNMHERQLAWLRKNHPAQVS